MGDTLRIPPEGQNLLTRRLLAQGVRLEDVSTWPEDVWRGDPGNFEYKREWKYTPTWESPCGLLIHDHGGCWGDLWWRGECWCAENDNPLFGCPMPGTPCPHRLPLPSGINCRFHRTERAWDEAHSVERLQKERAERLRQGRELRLEKYPGWDGICACLRREELPDGTARERACYDVSKCIDMRCKSTQCVCRLGAARDVSPVNIYYDLLLVKRYKLGFAQLEERMIRKDLRVFDKAVARTDAEIALRIWRHDHERAPIMMRRRLSPEGAMAGSIEGRGEAFMVRVFGRCGEREECSITATVQNIRVARSAQRDLMQDLQDVRDGIAVTHESDLQKAAEAQKREQRERYRKAKARRKQRAMEGQKRPEQLSLFGAEEGT